MIELSEDDAAIFLALAEENDNRALFLLATLMLENSRVAIEMVED